MKVRRWTAAAIVVLGLSTSAAGVPAEASDTTRCAFGGPAGTSRVTRLDLPEGSPFVNVAVTGSRAVRPAADRSSWHLAQGVFVLDETGTPVAHRIANSGSSNRQVVAGGGEPISVPGPDLPFSRADHLVPVELAPGTYYLAAFGSDGDEAAPDDTWTAFVEVAGSGRCTPLGAGRLVDVSHADFEGGNQVSAPGVAVVDGATFATSFAEEHVVGLVDASVQFAGTAEVDVVAPDGGNTVSDALAPLATRGGELTFTARVQGVVPVVAVVAMGFDLP